MGMLTQKRLKELLNYNPDTGIFTWRVDRRGGAEKGDRAGSFDEKGNRRAIRIDKKNYPETRLAVLYMTGEWPDYNIYHMNGLAYDNRWENLLDTNSTQLSLNQKLIKKLLNYNPNTGVFTWKIGGRGKAKIGSMAGCKDPNGYKTIRLTIGGKQWRFLAHRLVFLYMEGELPPDDLHVHHKNGIRDDNRWENLEIATVRENMDARSNYIVKYNDGTFGRVRTTKGFGSMEEVLEFDRKVDEFITSLRMS